MYLDNEAITCRKQNKAEKDAATHPDGEDGLLDATILVERVSLYISEQIFQGLGLGCAVLLEQVLERDDDVGVGDGAKGGGFSEVGQGAGGTRATGASEAKAAGAKAGAGAGPGGVEAASGRPGLGTLHSASGLRPGLSFFFSGD